MKYTNQQITDWRTAEQPDAKAVETYRDYASGRHREVLTTKQQKLLGQRAQHPMTDNILDLILATTASRLTLEAWVVAGEAPASLADGRAVSEQAVADVTAFLAALWLYNRLPRLQYETHYAQLRDGNSAIGLAYRNGRVRLKRDTWWDGTTGVFIGYDDEYAFAVKEWVQRELDNTTITRRTVYEPGLMTRWVQRGNGWEPYERPNEPAEVPLLRGTGETARPLPIPWVHFPAGTGVTDGVYGESTLAPLLALQDDLNATQLDIAAAGLMTAFQRIFISGMDGQAKITIEPGGIFGSQKPDAKVQVIEPGDISQLTKIHEYKRQEMGIVSRTPMHVFTGQFPSGAALLRSEQQLVDKATALADVNGPQWTMVAHRAMELANAFGGLGLDENVPLTSRFAAAERIDELTELEIKTATVDLWERLSRLPREAMIQSGLVEEDTADQIIAEREAQQAASLAALMSSVDTGQAGAADYGEGSGA